MSNPRTRSRYLGGFMAAHRAYRVSPSSFFKNIKRLNQIENEYKGRMKAGEDAESFRKQEPLVDQIGLGNQAEAAIGRVPRPKCPHRYPELAPLDPIKGGSIRPISDRPLKQLSSRPDR